MQTTFHRLSYVAPLRVLKGAAAATLLYPIAERLERRDVRSKVAALRRHYRLQAPERQRLARQALVEMLRFAGSEVPYYRDLFASHRFTPDRVLEAPEVLAELPVLTKDIIAEQGSRLRSQPLEQVRHHACPTGGSTGRKAIIYYDQEAADHSSAVTTYARSRIGAARYRSALHFAAYFGDAPPPRLFDRESFKTLAMNRSNIFFDRLDADALDAIWAELRLRRPYLVHAHPSTIHALACHVVDRTEGRGLARPLFSVFESSGELLEARQRRQIAAALGCRLVDRYGLAEFGVVAYEFGAEGRLDLLDSEVWAETLPALPGEAAAPLLLTSLRNRLMPLIRYETGDLAVLEHVDGLPVLGSLVGRIHDIVPLNGQRYPTHHLQDVLDHRVGGIREFQFDLATSPPTLRLVAEPGADANAIAGKIEAHWPRALRLEFCGPEGMLRVGGRSKFRHVVNG